MGYSKISKVRVKNFRIIGDTVLDFSESPIITLVGDNESGKTSLVKAFCVAGLNAYNKKQKKYIKDGTNGFGIEIQLEDGSIVQRFKTNASNILKIKRADGTVWETNKIDAGGIPIELQKVMGLIEEPETKEFLQVRTYEDQLLFVVTPASANYKVMYDALKVENLTKAIKIGTDEANVLRRSLDECTTIRKHLEESIRNTRLVDIEPLINIRNRIKDGYSKVKRIGAAKDLSNQIVKDNNKLSNINKINSLTEIDIIGVEHLSSAIELYKFNKENKNRIEIIKELESLDTIDIESVKRLEMVKAIYENDIAYKKESKNIDCIKQLNTIEISLADKLNRIHSIIEYNNINKNIIENIRDIKDLSIIETNTYNKLSKAIEIKKIIRDINIDTEISSLTEIKETSIHKIEKLIQGIRYKQNIITDYKEYNTVKDKINELNNILKRSGAKVINCPKCGEDIVLTDNSLME